MEPPAKLALAEMAEMLLQRHPFLAVEPPGRRRHFTPLTLAGMTTGGLSTTFATIGCATSSKTGSPFAFRAFNQSLKSIKSRFRRHTHSIRLQNVIDRAFGEAHFASNLIEGHAGSADLILQGMPAFEVAARHRGATFR